MEDSDRAPDTKNKKKKYEAPEILASYDKEELEALMQPEASVSGCGCGSL